MQYRVPFVVYNYLTCEVFCIQYNVFRKLLPHLCEKCANFENSINYNIFFCF